MGKMRYVGWGGGNGEDRGWLSGMNWDRGKESYRFINYKMGDVYWLSNRDSEDTR